MKKLKEKQKEKIILIALNRVLRRIKNENINLNNIVEIEHIFLVEYWALMFIHYVYGVKINEN